MVYTLEELKERLVDQYDPDEIVELLDLSTEQIVEAFEDLVIKYRYKFDETGDDSEDDNS